MTADRIVLPRRWVAGSALHAEVVADSSPENLAALHARRGEFDPQPGLEKCVAEAVYGEVRAAELPDAPSRLECLYAASDAYGAIDFLAAYGPPLQFDANGFGNSAAIPVSTADGRWVALDMRFFALQPIGSDPAENARSLSTLRDTARRYWLGEQSSQPFIEILAEKLWQWTAFVTDTGVPADYATWSRGQSVTN